MYQRPLHLMTIFLAAVFVPALLATPPPVRAQSSTYTKGQTTDAAGNTKMSEAFPLDSKYAEELVFSDTLSTAGHMADSTGTPFQTAGYHTLTFFFYPVTTAAVDSVMYLAWEVRGHFVAAADSNATFHVQRIAARTTQNVGTQRDTLGHPTALSGGLVAGTFVTAGYEGVIALRADVLFSTISPAWSPKCFSVTIKDWSAPDASLRFRVLNPATPTGGAGLRRTQLTVLCHKSAL